MKNLVCLLLILATVPVLAGVPVISSITPDHGPVSSTVTITGSQFSGTPSDNIVRFGTVRATVVSSSLTEIKAVVPGGAASDQISVTIAGFTSYSPQTFIVTFPPVPVDTGSYAHYFKLPTGASLRGGRALVDLDDDGRLDLVGPNDDNTVVVYRNASQPGSLSAASFAAKQAFPTGYRPYYVVAADFNSDGKLDLATANNSGNVSVLKNTSSQGAISFASAVSFDAGGGPSSVEVGDFNGDGKVDMAVSNNGANTVSILINTGAEGGISFASAPPLVTPFGCGNAAVADLDGDGKPDVAVANGYHNLTIFRNVTTRADSVRFAAGMTITTVDDPRTVTIGDIDGDGKPDVVMTSCTGPNAWVFRNTSIADSISFASPLVLSTVGLSWYTSLADLNGDGKLDLIVPNTSYKILSIYTNTSQNGSLSFAPRVDYASEYDMLVGAGDLDRDGLPDIVLGDFYGYTGFTVFPRKSAPSTHTLTVKDGGTNSATLTFGTYPGATNGIDTRFGETLLPPVPPQGAFDVRFILPSSEDASLTDFRPDTSVYPVWRAIFQPGPAGYPMRLSWDSVQFAKGTWTLRDEVTGSLVNINLGEQSSVQIQDTRITSLLLSYIPSEQTIATQLRAGWNMVSVPLDVDTWSAAALFPGLLPPAYGFENTYVSKSTLEITKGYWVRMPSASTASFTGDKHASGSIPLVQGWNLVGPLEAEVSVSALQTTPPGILLSSFFGFDGAYFPATTLVPGHGYWVLASQSGTLECRPTSAPAYTLIDSLASVDVTDASGMHGSVYFARRPVPSQLADMPPSAPAGSSDIRFTDDTWVHYGTMGSTHQVHLSNFTAPLTIRSRNAAGWKVKVQDSLAATVITLTDQPVAITQFWNSFSVVLTQTTGVDNDASTMPTSVRLLQNYPNPFNPSTMISFELPRRGFVTLEVFNTLGQRVATLLREERQAGSHQVRFDASGLSSGLYYYRLVAGEVVQTNKMMLVK